MKEEKGKKGKLAQKEIKKGRIKQEKGKNK